MHSTVHSTKPRSYAWLAALIFALITASFIHTRAYSTNDASRLASIDSLVERGTWAIDDSIFATIDRIKVGEHFYSDKPPLLSFVGAGVYSVLRHTFGLTLQSTSCDAMRLPTNCRALLESTEADWAYFILTFLLITLPGALMVALLARLAERHGFGSIAGLVLALLLGFATAIWPYSTIFTNHVPAAAALMLAVYVLLIPDRPTRTRLALAGFSAALATMIDLSAGVYAIGLLLYLVWRYRSDVRWFVLGALPPILLTIALDYQIVGNPFPPQMYTAGYNYPGTSLGTGMSGFQSSADIPRYIFDFLIGQRGALLFFPIIIWYLIATFNAARSDRIEIKWLARVIAIGSVVYLLYFALSTDNFGGNAFSPRWLLNPVPLLAIFTATDRALYRPRWRIVIIGLLVPLSLIEAHTGALNPWTPAFPALRVETMAVRPAHQPNVALSGYGRFIRLPVEIQQMFGANDIVPRTFDATRGLVVPSGEGWWFIDDSTPLAFEIAGPLGLSVPTTLTLNADLTSITQQWLNTLDHTVGLEAGQVISLPVTFGNDLTLLSYQVKFGSNKVTIITAWRMEVEPNFQDQHKAVFDLIGPNDESVQHNESFAARYDTLHTGDIVIHVQRFPSPPLPPDQYRVEVGVVDTPTTTRLTTAQGHEAVILKSVNLK